jgi:hypothetical protein
VKHQEGGSRRRVENRGSSPLASITTDWNFRVSRHLNSTELERELEALVKRLDPLLVLNYIGARLGEVRDGERPIEWAAPHVLARIIEATCAYHRAHYREPITKQQYAKLHNLLTQHSEEFDSHALTVARDIDLFTQRLFREQIPLQYRADLFDIARIESLIHRPSKADALCARFRAITGLPLSFFSSYSYLIRSSLINEGLPGYRIDRGTVRHGGKIEPELVNLYLRQMALSVGELGAEYKRRRAAIQKPYLKSFARRVLLDRPLVLTSEELVMAPFPDLIMPACLRRLFEILDGSDERQDLDAAFEEHVERWMAHLVSLTGGRLGRPDRECLTHGKQRCDFLLRTNDYIILVECKTTYELPVHVTETAIANSGAAKSLAKAIEQLAETSAAIGEAERPVYAMVVVPFEIPLVNSDWFHKRAFPAERAANAAAQAFAIRPQILAAHDFEYLITLCERLDCTVADLLQRKAAESYHRVGDWGTFLRGVQEDKEILAPEFALDLARSLQKRSNLLTIN